MAIMLPVGPGGLYGDSSLQGAPESPPTDTTNSISSDGGANSESNPNSTGTLSGTSDTQSFRDTLSATQQSGSSKGSAKHQKSASAQSDAIAAVPLALAFQTQQSALGLTAPGAQGERTAAEGRPDEALLGAKAPTPAPDAAPAPDGPPDPDAAALLSKSAAVDTGEQAPAADAGASKLAFNTMAQAAVADTGARAAVQAAGGAAVKTAAPAPPRASANTVDADGNSGSQTSGGQESASDLHSLSSPTQTLASSDAAAASHDDSKQDANDSQGGSSGQPQQMNWTAPSAPSGSSPSIGPASDAKVAGAGMAERVDVVRQVAAQFSASTPLASAGQHTVTLNINPDHWGALTINLTMGDASASGQSSASGAGITATIVAQSSAVRDALIGQSKDLQNALESAGVKLQRLDIITSAAAAGTVAAGHSAAQSGFNTNSQGNSSGQQSQQPHSNATPQDASGGQQGQGSRQHFESMFGESGQNQPRNGWLPSIASAQTAPEPQSFTPVGLARGAPPAGGSGGINVLA